MYNKSYLTNYIIQLNKIKLSVDINLFLVKCKILIEFLLPYILKYFTLNTFKHPFNSAVYVLLLNNDTYYIGKSDDIIKRLERHFKSDSTSWVTKGEGIKNILLPIQYHENLSEWEKLETLYRMKLYGVQNVRGFGYTKKDKFSDKTVNKINAIINNIWP